MREKPKVRHFSGPSREQLVAFTRRNRKNGAKRVAASGVLPFHNISRLLEQPSTSVYGLEKIPVLVLVGTGVAASPT